MRTFVVFWCVLFVAASARSQDEDHSQHEMQHASNPSPWMVMTDGVVFAMFNHQGSDRGGTEF
jgi:hypothetical protein